MSRESLPKAVLKYGSNDRSSLGHTLWAENFKQTVIGQEKEKYIPSYKLAIIVGSCLLLKVYSAQNMEYWRAPVNGALNLRIPQDEEFIS